MFASRCKTVVVSTSILFESSRLYEIELEIHVEDAVKFRTTALPMYVVFWGLLIIISGLMSGRGLAITKIANCISAMNMIRIVNASVSAIAFLFTLFTFYVS